MLPHKLHKWSNLLLYFSIDFPRIVKIVQNLEKPIKVLLLAYGSIQLVDSMHAVDELSKNVWKHGYSSQEHESTYDPF